MLLLRRELAERATARGLDRRFEHWVIAKAGPPPRSEGDATAARAAPHDDLEWTAIARRRRTGQGEDAYVPGESSLGRQPGKLPQELCVVLLVGRVRTRVAACSNARRPVERIDLQARVVGERRQARCPGTESGLDPSVRLEGQAILDRISTDPEVIERDELGIRQAQQLAQLPELVLRSGRDEQSRGQPATCGRGRGPRIAPRRGEPGRSGPDRGVRQPGLDRTACPRQCPAARHSGRHLSRRR